MSMRDRDRDGTRGAANSQERNPGARPSEAGGLGRFHRREMLSLAAAASAVGLAAGTAPGLFAPREALAPTTLTPDTALRRLIDGNGRYVAGSLTAFSQDLSILKQKTAEKQQPFAAVLSCADSRVPVEIVFDQSIGHVFV